MSFNIIGPDCTIHFAVRHRERLTQKNEIKVKKRKKSECIDFYVNVLCLAYALSISL